MPQYVHILPPLSSKKHRKTKTATNIPHGSSKISQMDTKYISRAHYQHVFLVEMSKLQCRLPVFKDKELMFVG